jgi:hypothetical protein
VAEEVVGRTRHRIIVLDEGSRPVADAVVALGRSSVPFPEIALLTNADGVVELQLPPGVFAFRVGGPRHDSADIEVRSPGPAETVVRLKRSSNVAR